MLYHHHGKENYCKDDEDLLSKYPLYCFQRGFHWPDRQPAREYLSYCLLDYFAELKVFPVPKDMKIPVVYLVTFVNSFNKVLFKYVGSTFNVAKRMLQHLESIWTGDSRFNGSLLMTSVGHKLMKDNKDTLSFFRVEILKKDSLPLDEEGLHEEERNSMFSEESFVLFGKGGLNVVDPVTHLYVLNGGVSLRHLQDLTTNDEWTCIDFVNNVILPKTRELGVSYHEYLEKNEKSELQDCYRVVPDFTIGPTCNSCSWKGMLRYMQRNATTTKIIKEGDLRPPFLHDAGNLYVHLNFLAINLHKEERKWPFALG